MYLLLSLGHLHVCSVNERSASPYFSSNGRIARENRGFSFVLPFFQELFQRQQGSASGQYSSSMMSSHFQTGQATKSHPSSPAKTGRVYASVAEMKRKGKVRNNTSPPNLNRIFFFLFLFVFRRNFLANPYVTTISFFFFFPSIVYEQWCRLGVIAVEFKFRSVPLPFLRMREEFVALESGKILRIGKLTLRTQL